MDLVLFCCCLFPLLLALFGFAWGVSLTSHPLKLSKEQYEFLRGETEEDLFFLASLFMNQND